MILTTIIPTIMSATYSQFASTVAVLRSIPMERKKMAAKTSRNGMMWPRASIL